MSKEDSTKEKMIRITADFSPEAYGVLSGLGRKFGSKAEALRKAINLLRYVLQKQEEGWVLALEKEGAKKEIQIL